MKKLTFQKNADLKQGIKSISLGQEIDDKDCVTKVTKGFNYKVSRTPELNLNQEKPVVRIFKSRDSQRQTESFRFDVRGEFYIVKQRMIYRVSFHHHLHIEIKWKIKIFSPKKSVVLTK